MEQILEQQRCVAESIKAMKINIKKEPLDRRTSDLIKRRLDVLEMYWVEFANNHEQLVEKLDSSHEYFISKFYENILEVYNNIKEILESWRYSKAKMPLTSPGTSSDFDKRPPSPRAPPPAALAPAAPIPQIALPITKPTYQGQGTESKMDEFIRKQTSNFKAFTRTISHIKVETMNDKWEFEDALRTLDARWQLIDKLHWEFDSENDGSNQEYEDLFTKHEESYNSMKKAINCKLWSVKHREKSTPQLDIPTFHGNYQQWVSFRDLFCEAVHKNPSLSFAQKMQFLKSKLKGEPERLIQHLQISSDNYKACWDILNHRYNNKKLIFTSHMNIIMGLPIIQQDKVTSNHIKRIHDVTTECLNAIKNLGVNIDTWDPFLVHILSQKLDAETHSDYMTSLNEPRELPKISDFLEFLENKFTTMESSRRKQEGSLQKPSTSTSSFPGRPERQSHGKQYFSSNKAITAQSRKPTRNTKLNCAICKSNEHGIYFCKEFNEMSPKQKLQAIIKLKLCCNCLHNHYEKPCLSDKRCRQCGGCHNTILHEAYTNVNISNIATGSNQDGSTESTLSNQANYHVAQSNSAEILLATALIKVQGVNGKIHVLRALIDQGSQISLMTENAAHRLGISRQKCSDVITGVGSKNACCIGKANISCFSLTEDYAFSTEVLIMKSLTRNLPNRSFGKPDWNHLMNMQLADPEFYISRPIDILLGADVYSEIILEGVRRSDYLRPIAQHTRLGWILCGKAQIHQCNIAVNANNMADIQTFWEIEDITEDPKISSEDQDCIEFYKATTIRLEDGRYQVRLPLKSDICDLGQSRNTAAAQFMQLERKFAKYKNIESEYKLFINEYLAMGHMKPSDQAYALEYFFPHHCVIREGSTTTALRVVFNASQKTSNGTCLNDFMHKGPNLQKDLMSLILSWRQYQVAYTADIEKMFRMTMVHQDDQAFQKILWRDARDKDLQEYQLTTISYGTKAAPFLAMMTLRQLAEDEQQSFPEAAKVVAESFYMDDLIYGSHNLESAKRMKQDLIDMLKSGGFNLRKWSSNYQALLEQKETVQDQENYDFNQSKTTKALGIHWNPKKDIFCFETKIPDEAENCESLITKRQLLSHISKLFDPLGWLTPVSTQLKVLFQRVWKNNIQWEDKIPKDIDEAWKKIKKDLININQIEIPRWLGTTREATIELHGFSDAAKSSYACVIYCKLKEQGDNNPKISIVVGKSKVVPCNKEITLPRKELLGAHLLAKLMDKVIKSLSGQKIQVYGWTDSTAVLGWIQGNPDRWKVFVSNRVRQITEVIPPENWQYVKSKDNPADCASRGLTATQLTEHSLWWNGPKWLPEFSERDREKITFTTSEEINERKQVSVARQALSSENIINDLLKKYSSWSKVVNVLAWIRRFTAKKGDRKKKPYLTLSEINQAKTIIIREVQRAQFADEIRCLKENKNISPKSKIANLHPFLDQTEVLRVGGRLLHANISPDMKNPIILPYDSKLTELVITHAHKLTYHGGARVTLAFIRQKYWVPQGNKATKKFIRQCVICKRQQPRLQEQIMADLPHPRVNQSRPFKHCAVDFTGHIYVKANKGRGIKTTKGYVAVFVCMATKAVHLELVSDLTSASFLAALRRLAARRSAPTDIYSDNGRNFIGACRKLQQEYQEIQDVFKDNQLIKEITDMEIKWHFNAPSWPTAGGLFEAAVKSVKFHFKRVVGDQALTFEEFSTVLCQIEACLNSRPLCALTEDSEDLNCLTPAHFLSGGPVLTIMETETDLRTRWKMTQQIVQDVWKRWKTEYLTQLSARSKWRQVRENVNINDIVIVHDDNLPPGKWMMGRVKELHPGQDGLVRVVTLKTKGGHLKRPVTKISTLVKQEDINEESKRDQQGSHATKKATRMRHSFITVATALLFFMTLISSSVCQNVTEFRDSQSLYFDKVSDMKLIKDEWKLIVFYDMQPYWQGNKALHKYSESLLSICNAMGEKTHCKAILEQLRHGCIELEYYNQLLLNQQDSSRSKYQKQRARRGLINGIGYIASDLFGVLDERFAEQYKQDIKALQENQKHTIVLWKKQTSIVQAQNNLMKHTEDLIHQQHKTLNAHMSDLESSLNKMWSEVQASNSLNDFAVGYNLANNLLNNLKSLQKTLIDTVTAAYQGSFNLHLLTPEQLIVELNKISSQIPKDEALPVDDYHTDLRAIYNLLKVKSRIQEESLIIEIKLPLISRDSYEILKIYQVPKSRNGKMISVVPVSDYIAINMKQDKYITMTEVDVKLCIEQMDTYFCHSQQPEYQLREDKNLCQTENSECKTDIFTCKDTWRGSYSMNTYLFFCCQTCHVRAICEDQMTSLELTKAGIITIGHGCVIKTDKLAIYPHKIHTSDFKMKPDLFLPKIAPINNIVNLTISPLKWLNDTQEEIKNKHQEIDYKIQVLRQEEDEAMKQAENISQHDIHHYAMIYVLLAVLVIAGAVYSVRHFHCKWKVTAPRPEQPAPSWLPPTPPTRTVRAAPPAPVSGLADTSQATTTATGLRNERLRSDRQDIGTSPVLIRSFNISE